MRLVGICDDCIKRLGVDERLTIPLNVVQVSKLTEYDAKAMAGVKFAAKSGTTTLGQHHGTTRITYKIAKTVKEAMEDAASATSHRSKSDLQKDSSKSSGP